jgi:hypothetical protein
MKPFEHNGRKYSNADAYRTAKATQAPQKAMTQADGAGEPDGDEQDGSAIAEQHGPAVEINFQHEHEAGSHHVHSVHADGHEHNSDHESADAAHEHAKKLAGVSGHAEPDGDGEAGY